MRIDSTDEFFEALANSLETTFAMAESATFVEREKKYREIEVQFLERAGRDAFLILETRRRVVEMILREANRCEQPFQACQGVWNQLVGLGFSNTAVACTMTRYYADCCLFNHEFDAGVSVIEPIIAELRQRLDDPTTPKRRYFQDELLRLEKLYGTIVAARTE